MPDLHLPDPIPIQREMLLHPARFLLLPWGRRASKTRLLWLAALTGHGPGWPDTPLWPGVLHGWDVVWLARDNTQGSVLWHEEIEPRLRGIPGIELNKQDKYANFRAYGGGALWMKSFENIDSVRGIGARLKGIITDEGAHFDLGTAWNRVLSPTLIDNIGWALFASTTNGAHDGNPEGEIPSYFNRLVLQYEAGELDSAEWFMTRRTARDNPRLPQQEVERWIGTYPPNSPELQEEVLALCIEGGGGLVFPYLREELHHPDRGGILIPEWRGVVAADWGWTSPAATGWICTDNGVSVAPRSHVYQEWWPTETLPQEWARQVCEVSRDDGIDVCLIDGAVQAPGQDGSPSIYEQMIPTFRRYEMRLIPVEKGPKSIVHSTQLLHQYLWAEGRAPLLTIDRACPKLWAELKRLRRGNPKERVTENPNIPAPHQEDHGFDLLRYWAMNRPKPAAVSALVAHQADAVMRALDPDPLSQLNVYRDRAREAIRQGKQPPPMAKALPVKQRRQPW